jgi:hypothetical protein
MTDSLEENSMKSRQAMGQRAMALGWLKRGRVKQAIEGLHKAIDLDPRYLEAVLELCRILHQLRRWEDLADLCQKALQIHLATPELHKFLITALEEQGTLEDAFAHYQLVRKDQHCLNIAPGEILCCLVARNELPRLPYLLDYYRQLGVDRFFACDNGSTDGSVDWLLQQPDVHLWCSDLSFKQANFGSAWFELLLRRYGVGHWCLTIDADEFLYFDGAPERTLQQFCADLDRRGIRAATGMLLDLYSDRPISETHYHSGDDPLTVCPYFDRKAWHQKIVDGSEYRNQNTIWGGVRQRAFPAEHGYFLSKAILLRYQPDVVLTSGQHLTNLPAPQVAREEICVLHFKFFASFTQYAQEESQREIHAMGGAQYKTYHQKMSEQQQLNLFDPEISVRFQGAKQLRELEVLQPEPALSKPRIPPIAPRIETAQPIPFWSVMITVYNRPQNVQKVLNGVLQQADPEMQIAVVCDHSDPKTQQNIAEEVQRLGQGRVEFYPEPTPLGHPHIFNRCYELARGKWVHILHDDDWLEPGFYTALERGIQDYPTAGAAFCQQRIVAQGASDTTTWNSWIERETPGLISGWLGRISRECRVQFSAMTVRRDCLEEVGGFCPDAMSAFDWELWVRIATRYDAFYYPEPMVNVGRDDTAETSRLMRTGEQVTDAFRAIDVMVHHLPESTAQRLASKARDRIAEYAIEIAAQFLERGDLTAAIANMQAAASGHPSSRTNSRLAELLRGDFHVPGI